MSSANYKALVAAAVIIFFAVIALVVGLILGLREEPGDGGASVNPGPPGMGGGRATTIGGGRATTTPGSETETTTSPPGPRQSEDRQYRFAAVAPDATICAQIGTNILAKKGGSAVDAAIATIVCGGIMNPHSMGIGGGFFMTVYDAPKGSTQKVVKTILSREVAPEAATEDMFLNKPAGTSVRGGLAIAVPGEIKGYKTAWDLYGKVAWKDLFQPTIDICKNGIPVSATLALEIPTYGNLIESTPNLKDIFMKDGKFLTTGDTMYRPKLCRTFERIAEDPNSFYTEGSLADDVAADIQEGGGIVTLADLKKYKSRVREPVSTLLKNGNFTIYNPPPPSSGVIVDYILKILDGYNLNDDSLSTLDKKAATYHKMMEAYKHGYAARSGLGDADFLNLTSIIQELTSESNAAQKRTDLNPEQAYGIEFYQPKFTNPGSQGTTHMSVLAPDGSAVAMTSTVNYYFASLVVGNRTGILFNDQMDDFSTPGVVNSWGFQASPSNFIKPGKMPMSSMSPSIILDNKSNKVLMVTGAAGGSRIITGTSWVITHKLWLGKNLADATNMPRLHDQLNGNMYYEEGASQEIRDKMKDLKYNVTLGDSFHFGVVDSIYNGCIECGDDCAKQACIYAVSDKRKGGFPVPDGY